MALLSIYYLFSEAVSVHLPLQEQADGAAFLNLRPRSKLTFVNF